MNTSPLHRLHTAGVSPWVDQISRRMLDAGDLERHVSEDAIRGVTSNPSIFAKAITGSSDYDDQVSELAGRGAEPTELIQTLMADDLRRACDVLRPLYDQSDGRDGFVSVEVTPTLAHETEASIEEARHWAKTIDRPNLLVKIPATEEGLPAIEQLIAEGISVNVTLIFSLQRYRAVMQAHLAGLARAHADGLDLSTIASVGSFFISRMDVEVDGRLDEIGTDEAMALRGTTAIANGRLAYEAYLETYRGEQWQELAAAGARAQRPLWASTSTKDPDYPDTLYVDAFVAPNTVNTMPLETIEAYQDHGDFPVAFGPEEIAEAHQTLERMEAVGVDYDDVMVVLEREGVEKFITSWDEVVDDVASEADKLR
ncbi:transaldolase [Salsipaludibacter albus]|uniref:transaldolase n=1 Tax=Salsipaludibacter albus TaxID=2849650 RepID=UPI001EE3E2AA|nr:transaldolase [Salsipaludibacter albus]MBY5163685.1 transaldolase [Salsipaludibacter albus]